MSLAINHSAFGVSGEATELVSLSKSRFVAGVQCLKRLYLQINAPETTIRGAYHSARLDQGQLVGDLARTAFPSGVAVVSLDWMPDDALAQTSALIEKMSVPAIFEATFRFEGIIVRVDILQRQPDNQWKLIEVKSSTSCKDHYVWDLAIQWYVLSCCGLLVTSVCLMQPEQRLCL